MADGPIPRDNRRGHRPGPAYGGLPADGPYGARPGGGAGGGRPGGRPPGGGAGSGPGGGRSAARQAQRSRRRRRARVWKIVGGVLAFLVLAAAAGGYYVYRQLDGNIHTDALSTKSTGKEKTDAFGRSPVNILVIGSDSRTDKADCKLGGACQGGQGGARADVEMVVHLSADRTNATVMSIPRDLVTDLPACTDHATGRSVGERTDMINSALDYGPDCQVAAVHHLTGIPIDHFMMVDFSGVVSMSDAIGGVDVCVTHNVYDPLSHLKLSAGTHTLKGVAALEFLRTRHGFGDGSDNVGRTSGQHAFLSAVIDKFDSAGTLTDPVAVLHLAEAATKSLTVDTGLGSITKLVGLAQDFSKIPGKRVTFTTMQNYPDPTNNARVVQGAGATTLFRTIADDQSLTTASGAKSSAAGATSAPVDTSTVAVSVLNGTSVPGRAAAILGVLTNGGFSSASTSGNAPAPASSTALTYPAGKSAQAKAVAAALGIPASHVKQGTGTAITLTLGADWTGGTVYPGGHPSAAPADTKAALTGAMQHNGGSAGCVAVSTQLTIPPGITPEQAYLDNPKVKNSAP